ncbi:Uncharacterized protein MSYG_2358 [Malassezia sympodialis ATCC 42132]|uniref:Uncharacterized protein n=1 Tax=Malassezia sympodialis (strain ATCC 42132) TaxID=1230383 RepID=A0A1M8A6C8_MALS4|nr:Uncharacterized protein MSYG_2358 [Malassezia sympodialis ATCC 42132]
MSRNVLQDATKVKASCGSSKEARYALDDSNETCWTLDLGSPDPTASALLTCTLSEACVVRQLAVWQATFAGGFVPVRMTLSVALTGHGKESQWQVVQEAFPKDGNMPQTFHLDTSSLESLLDKHGYPADISTDQVRIQFEGSTDGFGRITIYELRLFLA